MISPAELFNSVVHAADVSPLLGPGTIRRALWDVGARAETAAAADYRRALPRIDARLRAYLDHAKVGESMQRIRNVVDEVDLGARTGGGR